MSRFHRQEVSWMNEFLQIEEYYNRFLQAKETLASWAGGAMAIIEGERDVPFELQRIRMFLHIENGCFDAAKGA